MRPYIRRLVITVLLALTCASVTSAQTTDITYQGKLVENALPANASYDFEFRLYDAPTAGTLLSTRTRLAVVVANGLFTTQLDFPSSLFDSSDRYLEIGVRPAGSSGGYQQLLPRQAITSAPYALRSLTATTATNATTAQNALQLGGVAANQYVLTTDPRMTDARSPLPGSTSYVQNTVFQQTSSNFSISGNGTAGGTLSGNVINATTQYNIGGNRILRSPGGTNLFVGVQAGSANTTGSNNAFFGSGAGNANTAGSHNAFFGNSAGLVNTTGSENTFVGTFAGINNTTGSFNAFFGTNAGSLNNSSANSFFGSNAGSNNTTGGGNAFFGSSAGRDNTIGEVNSFFGNGAGARNTTGNGNTFFGAGTGDRNTTGSANAFFGVDSGLNNTTGNSNAFFGTATGYANTTGTNNAFFGDAAGGINTTGSNNTLIGAGTDVGAGNLSYATAIGAGTVAYNSNTIILGRNDGSDTVSVPGTLYVSLASGALGDVCYGFSLGSSKPLTGCSSSLRYKTDVQSFSKGLDVVQRLRPIMFNWKTGGLRDVGFAAEEVKGVEPLLVTYNDRGEIEGVKYKQLTTILVNAVKEQQTQIEEHKEQLAKQQRLLQHQQQQNQAQQTQLRRQRQQLEALKRLVCQSHPQAEVCK